MAEVGAAERILTAAAGPLESGSRKSMRTTEGFCFPASVAASSPRRAMPHTLRSSWLSRTLAIAVARSAWSWTTRTRIGEIEDLLKRAVESLDQETSKALRPATQQCLREGGMSNAR